MQSSSEQPLVEEEHCVTTLITAAKETISREVITFSDGRVSSISANSLIILCVCSVCNVALNFCGDSFSQINCFGRCNNVKECYIQCGVCNNVRCGVCNNVRCDTVRCKNVIYSAVFVIM